MDHRLNTTALVSVAGCLLCPTHEPGTALSLGSPFLQLKLEQLMLLALETLTSSLCAPTKNAAFPLNLYARASLHSCTE